MSKLPVKRNRSAVHSIPKEPTEVLHVHERGHGSFVSFRYSYTEISADRGTTRVRARSARLEDGKLTREDFEGELAPGAYERAVGEMRRQLLEQMASFWRPFTLFQKTGRRGVHEDD